jgi:hypothetical protein
MSNLSDQIDADITERSAKLTEEHKQKSAQVSIAWKRSHLNDPDGGFNDAEPSNTKLIADYIKAHGLKWSVESLDEAYAAVYDRLIPVGGIKPAPEPVEEISPWPWGKLTEERIINMSTAEMKKWMYQHPQKAEFQRQVDALNIPESKIKRSF